MSLSKGGWIVETDDGPVGIEFAPRNGFGVLDHWGRLPDGSEFFNPMRVVPDGDTSLVSFTLFRQDGWDDERLASDAALVQSDLERLKALVGVWSYARPGTAMPRLDGGSRRPWEA